MDFLNLPTKEQFDTQNTLLASIASHVGTDGIAISNWDDVQRLVRMGLHSKMFTVGDQFVSTYDTGSVVWDVIGINHDIPTDKKYTNSLTLQAHDCILNAMVDNVEALYYASAGLIAGEHIFTLNSLKYKVTTTQNIPAGGQMVIAAWQSAEGAGQYVPTTISTYAADRTTTIETGLVVTTASGDDTLIPVNHYQRCRYGSNNYIESAIKQWLNDATESFTWVAKTNYDRPPTETPFTGKGFLNLLDPDLVSVLGTVDKQVAKNTVTDGGGQDLFSDKVFLLSRVEVYGGTEGVTTGESAYAYYSAMTDNPTTDVVAGRIKYLGGSTRFWWLRSPNVSNSNNARNVNTTGNVNNNNAINANGAAPVCVCLSP